MLGAFLGWAAVREQVPVLAWSELPQHPTAAALLSIGGLALCLVIVAVRLGWFTPAPSLPDDARVAATATITPQSHYFADIVTARLELLFRHDRVPPSSVKVTAPFTPYTVVSKSAYAHGRGEHDAARLPLPALCVTFACLPRGERKLAPPRTRGHLHAERQRRTLHVLWPRTIVVAAPRCASRRRRCSPRTCGRCPRSPTTSGPRCSPPISLTGALLLLLLAVALLVPALPRSLGVRRPHG